jgi:hypothetical protein
MDAVVHASARRRHEQPDLFDFALRTGSQHGNERVRRLRIDGLRERDVDERRAGHARLLLVVFLSESLVG